MSLDKFISENQPKKKKKPSKSIMKDSPNSVVDKVDKKSSEAKTIDNNKSQTQKNEINEVDNSILEQSQDIQNSNNISEEHKLVVKHSGDEEINNQIFVEQFRNKNKNELFFVLLDVIHSHPSYSRNKNLLAKYLADAKEEIVPEILANELEISLNEVLVLLAEIKEDMT